MDKATVYETVTREFDSLRQRQIGKVNPQGGERVLKTMRCSLTGVGVRIVHLPPNSVELAHPYMRVQFAGS